METRKLFSLTALALALASGCGSSSSSNLSGNPGVTSNNATTQGTLNARVDLTSTTMDEVVRFLLEVYGPDGTLLQRLEQARAGTSPQVLQLSGLPDGNVLVTLSGQDSQGQQVGYFEQQLKISGDTVLEIPALANPGQTREIGRVSVDSNQQEQFGNSNTPSINSLGSQVTFASSARLANTDGDNTSDIFLRLRTAQTTQLISSEDDGVQSTNPRMADSTQGVLSIVYQHGVAPSTSIRLWRTFLGAESITPLTPAAITLPDGKRTKVTTGQDPWISRNGQQIVYSGLVDGGSIPQIVLTDPANNARVLSQLGGILANGECSDPVISPDGTMVFFTSSATNLTSNGVSGLFACKISSGDLRVIAGPSAFACACNKDGTQVAANIGGRLLLINLGTGQTAELPAAGANAIIGPPSMDDTAKNIAFQSSRSDLVSNDKNGVSDMFVFNTVERDTTRVNIAPDGSCVRGIASNPSMAGNGSRVAFQSADDRLVENDNNFGTDVFTSVVPTDGLLYVCPGNKTIQRYRRGAFLSGSATPQGSFTVNVLDPGFTYMALDTSLDRLYLFVEGGVSDSMYVVESVSTRTGTINPDRSAFFSGNPFSFFQAPQLDLVRDFVVGDTDLYKPLSTIRSNASVVLPSRSTVNPAGLLLYPREALVYNQASSHSLTMSKLDQSGTPLGVVLSGNPSEAFDVVLDANLRFTGNTNNADVVVLNGPDRSLEFFPLGSFTTSFGGSTRKIRGVATQLAGDLSDANTQLEQDRFNGDLYVNVGSALTVPTFQPSILVFPADAANNVAPKRRIIVSTTAARPIFALDRTR